MKKIFLFISLFFYFHSSFSQNKARVDSLLKVTRTSTVDSVVRDAFMELCIEYRNTNADASRIYAQKGIMIAEKEQNKKSISQFLRAMGNSSLMKSDFPDAMNNYLKALRFAEEIHNKKEIAKCEMSLGMVYNYEHQIDLSLRYYEKCLRISEELGEKTLSGQCYGNMALEYLDRKDYQKALEYSLRSLKVKKEQNDEQGVASVNINIGLINTDLHNYDAAIENYKIALEINQRLGQDKEGIALSQLNMGRIYYLKKDYKKAIELYDQSLVSTKEMGNLRDLGYTYDYLSEVNAAMGNYKAAHEFDKMEMHTNDSMYNESNSQQLLDLKTEYEVEKKQKELEAVASEQKIKSEAELQKQTTERNAFIAGFALLLVLALVVLRGYNQKRRTNREISHQKELLEEKNREITDSINYAQRIQAAVLPSEAYFKELFPRSFILFKPKDIVSGDFYWITRKNDLIFYVTADCTGHGVPGGFMSMLGTSLLNEIINEKGIHAPSEILDLLRDRVITSLKQTVQIGGNQDGMDMILCCINTKTNILTYAAANNSLYILRNKELTEYKSDKQPIGIYGKDHKPFTQKEIQLHPEDQVYTYTDGYADQFGGPSGKKFKYSQFERLLTEIGELPPEEQKQQLEKALVDWQGRLQQVDDVCVIGLRI